MMLSELDKSSHFDLSIGSVQRSRFLHSIESMINQDGWEAFDIPNLAWLGLLCVRVQIPSKDLWVLKGQAIQKLLPLQVPEHAASLPRILTNYAVSFPFMPKSFFQSISAEFAKRNSYIRPDDNIHGMRALKLVGCISPEIADTVLSSILQSKVNTKALPTLVNAYSETFEGEKKRIYKQFVETNLQQELGNITAQTICHFVKSLADANFDADLVASLAAIVAKDVKVLTHYQLNDCIRTFSTYDKALCKPFITEKNGRPIKRSSLLTD